MSNRGHIEIDTVYVESFARRKISPISPMHATGENFSTNFFAQ